MWILVITLWSWQGADDCWGLQTSKIYIWVTNLDEKVSPRSSNHAITQTKLVLVQWKHIFTHIRPGQGVPFHAEYRTIGGDNKHLIWCIKQPSSITINNLELKVHAECTKIASLFFLGPYPLFCCIKLCLLSIYLITMVISPFFLDLPE